MNGATGVLFRCKTPNGCLMTMPVGNVVGLEDHRKGVRVLTRSNRDHSTHSGIERDGKRITISTEPFKVLAKRLKQARARAAEVGR